MDLKPLIPPGLIERIVGLSGLQRAYFGVQNAGRNVDCFPQGPLSSQTRTPGSVAAQINGDVSKGRHHTVTVVPMGERPPLIRGASQALRPSPLVARIRFAQDGCWTEVDVDVGRGINVTIPAAMIQVILHNEGPISSVNPETGEETVGRIVQAAVFIDEMPYFKRHNARRTQRFALIAGGGAASPVTPIPAFATELAAAYAGVTFGTVGGAGIEFQDEDGGVVAWLDYSNIAPRPSTVPIPNGATRYRIVNTNGPGTDITPVIVWELAF
jgi:hypothetical protein